MAEGDYINYYLLGRRLPFFFPRTDQHSTCKLPLRKKHWWLSLLIFLLCQQKHQKKKTLKNSLRCAVFFSTGAVAWWCKSCPPHTFTRESPPRSVVQIQENQQSCKSAGTLLLYKGILQEAISITAPHRMTLCRGQGRERPGQDQGNMDLLQNNNQCLLFFSLTT